MGHIYLAQLGSLEFVVGLGSLRSELQSRPQGRSTKGCGICEKEVRTNGPLAGRRPVSSRDGQQATASFQYEIVVQSHSTILNDIY